MGTKRLASQEFFQDWENKRLNSGNVWNYLLGALLFVILSIQTMVSPFNPLFFLLLCCCSSQTDGQPQPYPSFNQMAGTNGDQSSGVYVSYPTYSTEVAQNWQAPAQIPLQLTTPALLGKG